MQAGDRVKIKNNPSRVGVLTSDPPIGSGARQRLVVLFPDGEEQLLKSALAPAVVEIKDPYSLILRGDYAGATHLRGAITQARLSGKLANLIYSLNTTNTQFFPYQFKPVLQYLDSPSRGLIVADEVGLGKTIEAGLIWTELRARQDAGRLLVVCPAMLREKWCWELKHRFGVKAQTVDSAGLLEALNRAKENPSEEFALVVSMQGSRPPASWNSLDEPSNAAAGKLARFLDDSSEDDPMLDLVIIDEAHYLRNKSTQTHLFARLLRQVTDGMVMLSATPIQMASSDLFNLLNLLDADAFPLEWVYDQSVKANAPIIALRDKLQHETVTQQEMREALEASMQLRWLDDNEQVNHLLSHMPTDQELASYRGRAKYAELLDRVNPRAKVITRTLKRDVQELRVQREPVTLRVIMTPVERDFYDRVTDAVRDYCEANRSFEGFLLTIPQRQMSSCLAGAYETWTGRQIQPTESSDEEFNSELAEGTFDRISESRNGDGSGVLLQLLTEITWKYGKGAELVRNDSKFDKLMLNLRNYWAEYPDKKVVLFAFYRPTLHYLARRLKEYGIQSVVLHGGLDKQALLEQFLSPDGPQILLSSEVASEGVDLQLSSLLVNYDLPWNPAKIEQRIGRIDRIGQEADKILIWNLIYEDTLDERVYVRLLMRLNIFKATLGSMEEILGEEVKNLTRDLLTHKLTVEDEERRIQISALALENLRINHELLDARASQLLGHGDFIQNKAKAAKELGRYIRGEDLYYYVKDYLETEFPGSRLIVDEDAIRKGRLELSIDAKAEFNAFLASAKLLGRTLMLAAPPPTLWFDNQHGGALQGVEKVTQDHPLIRFISDRQQRNTSKGSYFPTSAIELLGAHVSELPVGVYVYVVMRWSFSGPRDTEKLVYEARSVATGIAVQDDSAEKLINVAAMNGRDWNAVAVNTLDHLEVARIQDECKAAIEFRFDATTSAQLRENRDRIREMNAALDQEYERKKVAYDERVLAYGNSENANHKRVLAMEAGKLKKLTAKHEIQKRLNGSKAELDPRQKDVSSGVIVVV